MHKTKSIQENEAYKIIWDLGIQMDHSTQARRATFN